VKESPARPSFRPPLNPKLEDFEELVRHEFSSFESSRDYSIVSDEELVLELVATESPARELVCALIDRLTLDAADIYRQALLIVRNPTPAILLMLHQRGASCDQLRSVVRARIKLNSIFAELRKRFERLPVAAGIYRAIVERLVADLIAEGVEASVPASVRETVNAVSEVMRKKHGKYAVQVTEVTHQLGVDKSTVSRRVRHAIELGFLVNLEQRRNQPALLQLGESLPNDDTEILPRADDPRLLETGFDDNPKQMRQKIEAGLETGNAAIEQLEGVGL
jgi:hypothetical protein